MNAVRVTQCRRDPSAGFSKAECQVIVLAAPADEAFIESIDRFEIFARDTDVVARELWLLRVTRPTVILSLDSNFEQAVAFFA